MSDKLVEVAAFSMPVEAHAARGLLVAEGIPAILVGEATVNVFSGIPVAGKITLHVAEHDAERAVALLAAAVEGEEDGDAPLGDDARLWLCPLCGDAVGEDLPECPACGTARPETWRSSAVTAVPRHDPASQDIQEKRPPEPGKITADTPIEAVPSALEGDLDVPDAETFLADEFVRRAFRMTVFGLWFFWLIFPQLRRLMVLLSYRGKVSTRVEPQLYLGIVLNFIAFVLAQLLWGALLLALFYRFYP